MKEKRFFYINLILFLVVILCATNIWATEDEIEIKNLFEQKYMIWKAKSKENIVSSSYGINEAFYEIVKIGIPVLPYIIDKIENNPEDFQLRFAVLLITKKSFEKSDWPEELGDSITAAKMYVNWWHNGHKQTPQQFEKLYQEWKGLRGKGKDKEAIEIYQKIERLGIVALPYMVKKVEQGDTDLISAISELTGGDLKKETKPLECVDWWRKNNKKWIIPFAESQRQSPTQPDIGPAQK